MTQKQPVQHPDRPFENGMSGLRYATAEAAQPVVAVWVHDKRYTIEQLPAVLSALDMLVGLPGPPMVPEQPLRVWPTECG